MDRQKARRLYGGGQVHGPAIDTDDRPSLPQAGDQLGNAGFVQEIQAIIGKLELRTLDRVDASEDDHGAGGPAAQVVDLRRREGLSFTSGKGMESQVIAGKIGIDGFSLGKIEDRGFTDVRTQCRHECAVAVYGVCVRSSTDCEIVEKPGAFASVVEAHAVPAPGAPRDEPAPKESLKIQRHFRLATFGNLQHPAAGGPGTPNSAEALARKFQGPRQVGMALQQGKPLGIGEPGDFQMGKSALEIVEARKGMDDIAQ